MFLVGVWLHTSINYMCYGCLYVQMTGEVQVTLEIQGIKKKGRTAVATSMHHHHPGHKMQNAEIYLHKIMLILLLFGYIPCFYYYCLSSPSYCEIYSLYLLDSSKHHPNFYGCECSTARVLS